MNKIAKTLTAALILIFFLTGITGCIITDMNGGLLLEWDDDDFGSNSNGNEPKNMVVYNHSNEQIYVAVDITMDERDQPNWNDPLWDGNVNKDNEVTLDIDGASNRFIWIYSKTLSTDQKTGQGSHFYEGDNVDVITVSVFKANPTN